MPDRSLWLTAGIMAMALAAAGGTAQADMVLLGPDEGFDLTTLEARDVSLEIVEADGGLALRVSSGHNEDWPGFTFVPDGSPLDLSAYARVSLDVRNLGPRPVAVCCRVDNPGGDGVRNCVTGTVTLEPAESKTLSVDLPPILKDAEGNPLRLFGMRGYPPGTSRLGSFDPSNVTQFIIFVPKPVLDHQFEVSNLRATGAAPVPDRGAHTFLPMIDEFGQYAHRDWPGKLHSAEEFPERIERELADLAANPGSPDWNEYGGWESGPTLEATGFFRVTKYDGKWWLVDPKGKLFWSHGIDCVGENGATPIEDRMDWFEWLPPRDSEYGRFYSSHYALHGYYAGRTVECFDFAFANLLRKYGTDWWTTYAAMAHRRLRSWGLNTIANWSSDSIYGMRRTPYVVSVGFQSKLLEGSEGYWGKFRDVFDESFERGARDAMAWQVGRSAGDPWCIGYFIDNEIAWGDEVSLAVAALQSPADQAAKRVFVDDLMARYGAIEELNRAWGTSYGSWDELLASREAPNRERAWEDLSAFYEKTAARYFAVCRDAVKAVAPNNLYLGCRFAWVNEVAAEVAARYCDVVSYNLYWPSVAHFEYPRGVDAPVIIGEFHFGALDRGMFHTGLVAVESQEARAETYKDYVRGALRHPLFVGCHWFKYSDEPTTGRPYDEENYQIGFLDVADNPYPETIEACREVGYSMYEYRATGVGEEKP